jgi:hypothetical protein
MAIERVEREPLARALVRGLVLALLIGGGYALTAVSVGAGFIYVFLELATALLPALAFAFVERTTDPWPRTPRADAGAIGLAMVALAVAGFAGRIQRNYLHVLLARGSFEQAMTSAWDVVHRDWSWAWFEVVILPGAIVLALLIWTRRRRHALPIQIAILTLAFASLLAVRLVRIVLENDVKVEWDLVLMPFKEALRSCAWFPLAARAADLAAARVVRSSGSKESV